VANRERFDVERRKGLYILKNKALMMEIIWLHHDVLVAEHKGRWKIIELVTRSDKRCRAIYRRI